MKTPSAASGGCFHYEEAAGDPVRANRFLRLACRTGKRGTEISPAREGAGFPCGSEKARHNGG